MRGIVFICTSCFDPCFYPQSSDSMHRSNQSQRLRKHVQESHPDAKRPVPSATRIPCPFSKTIGCSFHARRPALLEQHIESVHGGQDEEADKGCEATNGATLLRDRLTGWAYENDERRRWPCPVDGCEGRFTRMYDVERHVHAVHRAG
jgi:hypothetical protein